MIVSMALNLRLLGASAVFLGYPCLVYLLTDYGIVWIAPLLVSFFYLYRWFGSRDSEARLVDLLLGCGLIAAVIFLKSLSAKFLPVLIQLMLLWLFGRSLLTGPPLIERFVRLDYPVFPPGIVEYCRQLTWIWTWFFGLNFAVCGALALWASDGWWAFYTGGVLIALTALLLVGEYFYRRHRFPDLKIPDPETSFRSILVNGRKIWMDVDAR
ncbi:MAG: hypothetical protein ACRERU_16590 [Methylococcales bacterium]